MFLNIKVQRENSWGIIKGIEHILQYAESFMSFIFIHISI
jgi:hypothetical protein